MPLTLWLEPNVTYPAKPLPEPAPDTPVIGYAWPAVVAVHFVAELAVAMQVADPIVAVALAFCPVGEALKLTVGVAE